MEEIAVVVGTDPSRIIVDYLRPHPCCAEIWGSRERQHHVVYWYGKCLQSSKVRGYYSQLVTWNKRKGCRQIVNEFAFGREQDLLPNAGIGTKVATWS